MRRIIQKEERPKKIVIKLVKISAIFLCLIFILEIWMVNRLATFGAKIEELKLTQANLRLENQVLENSIAQKSSLSQIEEKSSSLGFNSVGMNNLEYIHP